jgi:hypothetical protein
MLALWVHRCRHLILLLRNNCMLADTRLQEKGLWANLISCAITIRNNMMLKNKPAVYHTVRSRLIIGVERHRNMEVAMRLSLERVVL